MAGYSALSDDFPVTFVGTGDAAVRWRVELEHTPTARSPLADALSRLGRTGAERAYAEGGLRLPSSWREAPHANGYAYFPDEPLPPEELAALIEGCRRLVERYGSSLRVWQQHSLPRVQEACAWLQAAPGNTPLAELADRHDYASNHTMVAGILSSNDLRAVAAICGELEAHELAQGYENETLGADAMLWRIAHDDGTLDEFLDVYGWQTTAWSIDGPTLREDDEGLRVQLHLIARDDLEDPRLAVARAATRRRRLAEEIRARLADDDEQVARFDRRVARLESFVAVREERALWQLIAIGSLRHAVLRRGQRLVDAEIIADAADVFFLSVDEVEHPAGDLRAVVARRRVEHDHWRSVMPPLVIGGTPADESSRDERVLRGATGARGRATGRARVILDLADAERLERGDILVCRMTSPPWTPLFAVAGAVVTDGGDIMSHVAIAAREYGLPCVVGTDTATTSIPDGAEVTVDGDAGVVEINRR